MHVPHQQTCPQEYTSVRHIRDAQTTPIPVSAVPFDQHGQLTRCQILMEDFAPVAGSEFLPIRPTAIYVCNEFGISCACHDAPPPVHAVPLFLCIADRPEVPRKAARARPLLLASAAGALCCTTLARLLAKHTRPSGVLTTCETSPGAGLPPTCLSAPGFSFAPTGTRRAFAAGAPRGTRGDRNPPADRGTSPAAPSPPGNGG
jgi:hypothetical protein